MNGKLANFANVLNREANGLLVAGTGLTTVFLTGGYYFSMKEKYERQVKTLKLRLAHEKMNHERDQQALSLLHLRRDTEKSLFEAKIEQQRWVMELAFHGDYEKFRDDLDGNLDKLSRTVSAEGTPKKLPKLFGALLEQGVQQAVAAKEADSGVATSHMAAPSSVSGSNPGASPSPRASPAPLASPCCTADTASGGVAAVGGHRVVSVKIKSELGEEYASMCVPNTISIADLRYEIEDRTLIPPAKQRLFFKGNKLSDGPSLDDYEVTDGSTIHMRHKGSGVFNKKADTDEGTLRGVVGTLSTATQAQLRGYMVANPGVLENLFVAVDRDNDEIISKEEMKAALYAKVNSLVPEDMSNVFRVIDLNNSGFINEREWRAFFKLVADSDGMF